MNKDKQHHGFFISQIVYILLPAGGRNQSQKVKVSCVGPLVIMNSLSPTLFELMTVNKQKFRGAYEETILRPGWIKTPEGPVNNYSDFLRAVKPVLNLTDGATGLCTGFPELGDIAHQSQLQ